MPLISELLRPAAGLLAGLTIGFAFGKLQDSALRWNRARQDRGEFKNAWSVMPGSMTRVAMLLLALAMVQYVCPILFTQSSQWWVSGGVVLGYGAILLRQLRRRLAASR